MTVERFFSHPETPPRKAAPTEFDALYAAKIVANERGFVRLAAAGAQHGWRPDLSEIAAIWRAGCIIRAVPRSGEPAAGPARLFWRAYYRRLDKPGVFHTRWGQDCAEEQMGEGHSSRSRCARQDEQG